VRVDVALVPGMAPPPGPACDVVVIDVLRATSTIVTALDSGAACVVPEGTVEQAAARARAEGALLGGEREGLAPPGYDLGNSPREYDKARCDGRRVVLSTTNGTQAVRQARGARRVLAAALLNAEATVRALRAGGAQDVLLLCAGSRGQLAADDVAAAGCLAGGLLLAGGGQPTDAARVAIALFDAWRHDLPGLLRRSVSGRRLLAIGLERDIDDCARVDALPLAVELDPEGAFRKAGARHGA
jgi:2-phosphosulfolactate phosphatase